MKQKNPRTSWTPELVADLVRLHNEKLKAPEIAERLGVDVLAVRNKIKRLREKPCKADVDESYIQHVEGLLKERSAELEQERAKCRELRKRYDELEQSALKLVMEDTPVDSLREIYAIADCLMAINLQELTGADSIGYLVCRIMEIAEREIRKEDNREKQ